MALSLITWFEKLCDNYPDFLALGYMRSSKTTFFEFHNNYLLPLLDRVVAWAQAENHPEIKQKAMLTSSELRNALESFVK